MGIGLALAGAAALPGCVAPPPPPPPPPADAWPEITLIGAAYLEAMPAEDSRSWLQASLGGPAIGTPPDVLLASLADTIAADHRDKVLVPIDGWHLSVTQCRIAAFWAKRDTAD